MPASAMKVYFQIAECRQSSAKIMPASAMRVYFQIAECRQSSAKIRFSSERCKELLKNV
jgi:hypothetical protein